MYCLQVTNKFSYFTAYLAQPKTIHVYVHTTTARKNNFPLAPTINLPPCLTLSLAVDDNKDLSVFVLPPCVTLFDAEPSRRAKLCSIEGSA